jgi:hypothetical protein
MKKSSLGTLWAKAAAAAHAHAPGSPTAAGSGEKHHGLRHPRSPRSPRSPRAPGSRWSHWREVKVGCPGRPVPPSGPPERPGTAGGAGARLRPARRRSGGRRRGAAAPPRAAARAAARRCPPLRARAETAARGTTLRARRAAHARRSSSARASTTARPCSPSSSTSSSRAGCGCRRRWSSPATSTPRCGGARGRGGRGRGGERGGALLPAARCCRGGRARACASAGLARLAPPTRRRRPGASPRSFLRARKFKLEAAYAMLESERQRGRRGGEGRGGEATNACRLWRCSFGHAARPCAPHRVARRRAGPAASPTPCHPPPRREPRLARARRRGHGAAHAAAVGSRRHHPGLPAQQLRGLPPRGARAAADGSGGGSVLQT